MLDNIKEDEIFKDIPGYEGKYQISNYGRIWSIKTQSYITPQPTSRGYNRVILVAKNGKRINERVARLVGRTFVPNPDKKPQIDHINRDNGDDRAENLRWVSSKENNRNRCNNRAVRQIDPVSGRCIATFSSVAEANEAIGREPRHSGIYKTIQGITKQSGGYKWEPIA